MKMGESYMGIEADKERDKMLAHRTAILAAEEAHLAGAPTYTQEELDMEVEKLLNDDQKQKSLMK